MKRATTWFAMLLSAASTFISPGVKALDLPILEKETLQITLTDGIKALLTGKVDGDEGPLNGIHWRVDLTAEGLIDQLPDVTCNGGGCETILTLLPGGFELGVFVPIQFKLHADAKINSAWSPELKGSADLNQTVGVRVYAPVSFDPRTRDLAIGEVRYDLEDLGGNTDVDGLARSGAQLGSLAGEFVLGIGWGLGAGLGAIAADAAAPKIERAIESQFAKLLDQGAHAGIEALNEYLDKVGLAVKEEALQNGAGPGVVDYAGFSLQTGSALHETDDRWAFALASNGDLFAIAKSGTGSGMTEVHVLSADSGYQEFSYQTATALHETGANFEFGLTGDRDLVAIAKNGTGSGSTEVHILSAASGYQEFVLQTGTALHETDDTFEFEVASNGDVYAISKSGTGTGSTEVHTLSAASGYQEFSLQTGTALHETGPNFDFVLAANRDLFALSKSGTGTGSTEVHILAH